MDMEKVKSIEVFLNILAPLIEIIQKAFKGYKKTQFFYKIIDRFNQLFINLGNNLNDQNRDIFLKLEKFLYQILESSENVSEIITIEPFSQFISFFPMQQRADVSQKVLKLFLEKDQSEKIKDAYAVHSLLSIAKNVNEYIAGGKEGLDQLAIIMIGLIDKINFGKDLETMLNLYTEIRANFGNSSEIIEKLIYKVIELTFTATKLAKNKITKKITGFLQACIAYCFITIPMILNQITQVKFYLLCSQVALLHNLISQSDAIFKSGLQVMKELPEQIDQKNTDEQLE